MLCLNFFANQVSFNSPVNGLQIMRLSRFRFYMTVFALLTFTGQSFAVVNLSCAAMDSAAKSTVMEGGPGMDRTMDRTMDHSAHMQSNGSNASDTADCCSQQQCAMTHCISGTVAMAGTPTQFPVQFSSVLDVAYAASYQIADTSPLFRPPISR